MIKKCKIGCCFMEWSIGSLGTQTCAQNPDGVIKSSREDLSIAWEQNRCVICAHPLEVWKPEPPFQKGEK